MDPRAKALSELARFQVASTSVGDALHRIAEITLDAVPAADVAGMTMLGEDGHPTTAVYTDPRSPAIDQAQYRDGTGPCLAAWRDKHVRRVDDIEAVADEYPGFSAACRDLRFNAAGSPDQLGASAITVIRTPPTSSSSGGTRRGASTPASAPAAW